MSYAVIFTSKKSQSLKEYDEASARMLVLVQNEPGFIGMNSARGDDGIGITVSYWESEESLLGWKKNGEHREAQQKGRTQWYDWYSVKICKIEREYEFGDKAPKSR